MSNEEVTIIDSDWLTDNYIMSLKERQLYFNPNPNPSREEYCEACRQSAKEGRNDE